MGIVTLCFGSGFGPVAVNNLLRCGMCLLNVVVVVIFEGIVIVVTKGIVVVIIVVESAIVVVVVFCRHLCFLLANGAENSLLQGSVLRLMRGESCCHHGLEDAELGGRIHHKLGSFQ